MHAMHILLTSMSIVGVAGCQDHAAVERTQTMSVTLYGARDNTPAGSNIAYPVIHHQAGGTGTYKP